MAAIAEGSRHAIFGVLGMLAGAALYAEVAPLMKATVLQIGDFGKLTLADATGVSPWVFLTALAAGAALLFVAIERWQRGRLMPQVVDRGMLPVVAAGGCER